MIQNTQWHFFLNSISNENKSISIVKISYKNIIFLKVTSICTSRFKSWEAWNSWILSDSWSRQNLESPSTVLWPRNSRFVTWKHEVQKAFYVKELQKSYWRIWHINADTCPFLKTFNVGYLLTLYLWQRSCWLSQSILANTKSVWNIKNIFTNYS